MSMDPTAFLKACGDGEAELVKAAIEAGQECSGVSEGKQLSKQARVFCEHVLRLRLKFLFERKIDS